MLTKRRQHEMPSSRSAGPTAWLRPLPQRERGAFSVLTAVLIIVILGVCGLAIDLSRMYNRKVELQSAADSIAMAAAAELNGTEAGVTSARTAALEAAANNATYDYRSSIAWTENALRFSTAPSGGDWVDADTAAAQPGRMFFVEVDTARLNARYGRVSMLMLQVLSPAKATASIRSRAVAGRSSVNVLPLAICAMTDATDPPGVTGPAGELVELGFRRGISYNLMNLNPKSNTKAANFLINPVAPGGTTVTTSVKSRLDVIEPFVCTGTLSIPQVMGANITVEHDFPLASVFQHLNSRFASYGTSCTPASAPPDTNIKEFTPAIVNAWMTNAPLQAAAIPDPYPTRVTIADLPAADIPAATTADQWGPLWIRTKAAKAENYDRNAAEPPAGYPTFATTDWATLYPKATPKLKASFPSPAPYRSGIVAPTGYTGVADRRVLNVALLRCPVDAGSPASAEVVGVGKFYMTVKATTNVLVGEFAGLLRQEQLAGKVELYR
jgi:Flp pilus assembly protein TadG